MTSIVTINGQTEVFSAPSLLNICVKACVDYARTLLFSSAGSDRKFKVRKSVHLPNNIWEKILENFDNLSEEHPSLLQIVYQKISSLTKIHVRNTLHLKDDDLQLIVETCCCSVSLDIHNCPSLSKKSTDIINKYSQSLESLCIGTSTQIIPTNIDNWMSNCKAEEDQGVRSLAKSIGCFFRGKSDVLDRTEKHGIFTLPKLRKLVIWGHHVIQTQHVCSTTLSKSEESGVSDTKITVDYWDYMTRDFIQNLEYLDLSSCQDVTDLSFLLPAGNTLSSLHLYDVLLDYDPKTWGILRNLTKLKFLDVSQYNELASVFANPDTVLRTIVSCLPELVGLDISGTNLAGFEPEGFTLARSSLCCISGLVSRKVRPLSFLGLLSTHYNASSRQCIPAVQIAGGDTIEQLVLSLKRYLHREDILRKAVRILHQKLLFANSTDFIPCYTILDLLLDAIKIHMDDKQTVIVALACCFHVLKRIVNGIGEQGCKLRVNSIFSTIVRSMEVHSHDSSLLRNSILNILLIISQLEMTALHAEKLVPVLLKAGTHIPSNGSSCTDTFLLRSIAHILYSATHLDDGIIVEKIVRSSVPEQMCVFMMELLSKGILDQMATFWIILLKFAANTTGNECRYDHFANSRVVELCFKLVKMCNEEYSCHDPEPYEVKSLREIQKPVLAFLTNLLHCAPFAVRQILKPEHINLIIKLLNRAPHDNHELQYVGCGFLAHVVSKDGSKELETPSRTEILGAIFRIVSNLGHSSKLTFSYRNLNQLYDLLQTQDAPEIHIWALWTLTKLVENDHVKFVNMIIQDGKLNLTGLPQLNSGECSFRCFWMLEALRGQLASIIDNHRHISNP